MPKKKTSKKKAVKKTESIRIKKLRNENGWTLSEVAWFMGLGMSTIASHESGERNITAEQARWYARLFRLKNPVDLFVATPTYATPKKKGRNVEP